MASQTWFGCGCSFIGHDAEKYCAKHSDSKPGYYAVWGNQPGWKEEAERFSERLMENLSKSKSILATLAAPQ